MRLTDADARARLGSARVATLATVGDNGSPHVVPITFAVEGDRIYSAVDHKPKTSTRLQRLHNITEHPRVSLLVHHYDDDWDALWWVRVDGSARVISSAEELRHPVDLLVERYAQYREHRPAGPVIQILADRWTGWSSS
ncbi:TIGR03668 family PPOX class F420-dependent oxidoreductase [Rathayibacter sp. CAU 1779]